MAEKHPAETAPRDGTIFWIEGVFDATPSVGKDQNTPLTRRERVHFDRAEGKFLFCDGDLKGDIAPFETWCADDRSV